MLSLNSPHTLDEIRQYPGGLRPIEVEGRDSLAIKAHKETLLAAQINKGFKVYIAPLPFPGGLTIGLVSAFFDDHDEPLVITTPLFDDHEVCTRLLALLTQDEIDIYFFDEHCREWMSYRVRIEDPGSLLVDGEDIVLLEPDLQLGLQMQSAINAWFSMRTAEDDARAIAIKFEDELWPSDLMILDMRDGVNEFVGSSGHSISSLTREKQVGYFQEHDIVAGFKRAFEREQIILNPHKRASHKEFADVVVGGEDCVMIVQAKDSPNTEASHARTIDRKRLTSQNQLEAAITQCVGAFEYAIEVEPVPLWLKTRGKGNGQDLDLYVDDREIFCIAIIREIFPSQGPEILRVISEWRDQGRSLAVLDYPGFTAFTFHFSTEDVLVAALRTYVSKQLEIGSWIKPQTFAVEATAQRLLAKD